MIKKVSFQETKRISSFYSDDPPTNLTQSEPLSTAPIVVVSHQNIPKVHFFIEVTGFFLYFAKEVAQKLLDSLPDLETIYVVQPEGVLEDDWEIQDSPVLYGVKLSLQNQVKEMLSKGTIKVKGLGEFHTFPGNEGSDLYNNLVKQTSKLQGLFFKGRDMVDYHPECLCYLVSVPRKMTQDSVCEQLSFHACSLPKKILTNPYQTAIMRLEFWNSEDVRYLVRRMPCFSKEKPVLVLPCLDRTPVELLYWDYQVVIIGPAHRVNTRLLLRVLKNKFGAVVELNVSPLLLGNAVVTFQHTSCVAKCLEQQDLAIGKIKLRLSKPERPYRVTGELLFLKANYEPDPPLRPLPDMNAPYAFEPPSDFNA